MKKLLPLILLAAFIFIFTGCEAVSGGGDDFEVWDREDPDKWAGSNTGDWTVMVWLDGDNDLEAAALYDFNEMEYGLYLAEQEIGSNINDDLAVIVQIDRVSGYVNGGLDGGPDWSNPRRYRITSDSNTGDDMIRSYQLANMPEISMGSAANLKEFITYCKTNYPANNYALILWNHGGGVKSYVSGTSPVTSNITKSAALGPVPAQKAVCWDEDNGDDCLYVGEITEVLSSSESVDLLGFDACLMGMAEIAYEYRPGNGGFNADYMAASVATEQGDGWEYQKIFNRFKGSGTDSEGDSCETAANISASEFAQIIVKEYGDAFSSISYAGETMAAYDLSQIGAVKTQLDSLASTLEASEGTSGASRDNSLNYFDEGNTYEWISNPHFDLYDYASNMSAGSLQTAVSNCVISSWGNNYSGFTDGQNGLGFFYPDGDITYSSSSIYAYQWWYTIRDTSVYGSDFYYGYLDFCDFDGDANVETWKELLEYWYDSGETYNLDK